MQLIINTVITGVVTFILGLILGQIKLFIKRRHDKGISLENAVQALLRNELIRGYRDYKTKGEITILDRENMEHLYKEYINLGGNGMIKDLWGEFLEIPTKVIKD